MLLKLQQDIAMTIPEFVKTERRKLNMTQVEFARHAGVGLRFIRDLEQGKKTLQIDKVNTVLAVFGRRLCSVSTLVPGDKR